MIIEGLMAVLLATAGAAIEQQLDPATNECEPDAVCYPVDPQDPKVVVPPNCFVDGEGGLVCYPTDRGKF